MELRLDGKSALVTGGSRGIGKAIARTFVEAGAQVMLASRKAAACESAAAEIGHGTRWFPAHVGDPAQAEACVDACVDAFGKVDVLVNNAGTNPYAGPTVEVDLSRWEKTIQVNLTAPLMWTQLAWSRSMGSSAGGCSVINIASVGGLGTSSMLGVYDITKAALIHLTSQLAAELGPLVRVNAIAPGLIKTDFARMLWEEGRDEVVARGYPLKRLGEPDDVAAAALYLSSDAGSWITGQTMVVDGGGIVAFRAG